jgi:hypothetical protein
MHGVVILRLSRNRYSPRAVSCDSSLCHGSRGCCHGHPRRLGAQQLWAELLHGATELLTHLEERCLSPFAGHSRISRDPRKLGLLEICHEVLKQCKR